MPITYAIDEARGLVLTTASGALTDDDILGLKAALAADPRWGPGLKELADIRAITRLDVTTTGVRRMVDRDERDAAVLATYRLAIVAPRDHVFGMARMYQLMTDRAAPHVGVFRELAEAQSWLGVE